MRIKIYIIIVIFIGLYAGSCHINNENDKQRHRSRVLKEYKTNFAKDYIVDNLLAHFPDNINEENPYIYSSPPSCPPSFKCSVQFGRIYLICKADTTSKFILNNFLSQHMYLSDSNIIINLSELRKDIFPVEKCNKWYANKLPIPYFENYNFGLGEKEEEKIIEGEEVPYYNYTFTIPSDLQVYVVAAAAGNYWKEQCNENRPESLKEWQNGYSKGFAISKKEDIVVYWAMIW